MATHYSAASAPPGTLPAGTLPAGISRRQWLAGAVLTVCTVLVMLTLATGPYEHVRGARFLLAFAVCSPLLLLRRWPLPVLAIVSAASTLALAADIAVFPFGIMLAFASYQAASRLPRRVSITATMAAAAAVGGALIYASFTVQNAPPLYAGTLECLVPLTAAWFVGDSIAAGRRYQAGLAEQAERERAAEAERARQQVLQERVHIARELHDVVAHTLAVITVQAGVGRRLAAKRPEEASSALESIETIGRTAQEELRVVLGLLRDERNRPAALAPAPGLVDLKELAETVRAAGTPVDLRLSGTDRQLSPALELTIYRVVQEALTNVVKHAPGARATVDLAVSARRVRLAVTDHGGVHQAPAGPGHGIVGMRERIGAFGGQLTAEPLAEGGFGVTAEIPIEGAV